MRTSMLEQELPEEVVLEDEQDEESADYSQKRKIYTEQGDPEIESLYNKFKKGKLDVQPAYQRQFVWDIKKSSRLIESLLLEIPIPIVYLAEDVNGKDNVVDGQQRLTTFFSFIDGRFPDGSVFKLTKLTAFPEYDGCKYQDLPEAIQDKIREYKIRTIKFKKESSQELQFEIFERLNSGSAPLKDQELRNCIYRGRTNDVLRDLAADKDFRFLIGLHGPDKRMKDAELVLRFAAFHFQTYLKYKAPIKSFLNNFMEHKREISPVEEAELRDAFKNSVAIIKSMLAGHAFKRFYAGDEKRKNGYWEPKKFNVSLYDILMNTFATIDKNVAYQNLDALREALINLMTSDQQFIDSIELSTSSVKAVTHRFDKWRMAVQEITGIGTKETRCFTAALKLELYQENPVCSLCGNKISLLDDAAVDHIKQYWTGGKTIPENARLTHRYCNNARPRTDVAETT